MGTHHGLVRCCLLKTSRVHAEVPRIAMLRTTTSPVMMAWAKWKGAGLIFILNKVCWLKADVVVLFVFGRNTKIKGV